MKKIFLALTCALFSSSAWAVNPYLPLWEHIPDGEPYVFDDPDSPGKKRVYIYGSHDMLKTAYCGTDLVVWSAPTDSLSNWRYDGVILCVDKDRDGNRLHPDGRGDVLYAPDVAEKILPDGRKEYYLYPNNQEGGRNGMVARASRPDGPFEVINWNETDQRANDGVLRFDPAVFIDDDGRVYGYWGFENSMAAELDPKTMATVKPGTEIVENLVSAMKDNSAPFHFFEASSIRKIQDKYVFIYSRMAPDGEWGLPSTNYTLAYAYSDNPLGPYTYGGTIIDARGRDTDASGKPFATATPNGNTHGSIAEINGQWWVFYHRQTGTDEYARQAMVAPIEVKVTPGPGGKVEISEAEYTSEGFDINGLNPLKTYPAAIASHFTGPTTAFQTYPVMHYSGPYFEPTYVEDHAVANPYDLEININPVVNNTDGSILGYKYFNFDSLADAGNVSLVLDLIPEGIDGKIKIYTTAPWKGEPKPAGEIVISSSDPKSRKEVKAKLQGIGSLRGRHPLYLTFESPVKKESICKILTLRFEKK